MVKLETDARLKNRLFRPYTFLIWREVGILLCFLFLSGISFSLFLSMCGKREEVLKRWRAVPRGTCMNYWWILRSISHSPSNGRALLYGRE